MTHSITMPPPRQGNVKDENEKIFAESRYYDRRFSKSDPMMILEKNEAEFNSIYTR